MVDILIINTVFYYVYDLTCVIFSVFYLRSLQELVVAHHNDHTLPVNPLSMKLSGILDAAVMGGITNYEKVSHTNFLN